MTHNGRRIIATNGEQTAPVRLFHWWPGREFKRGWCPIPRHVVRGWKKNQRRYATHASIVPAAPMMPIEGSAECGPSDTPTRQIGREIALGRLAKELKLYGWKLEAVKT